MLPFNLVWMRRCISCQCDAPWLFTSTSLTPALLVQMKRISVLIMRRSARLLAAAVAGLMKHLNRDAPGQRNSVMADGGICTGFQPYHTIFEEGIADICGADMAAGFKCQVTQGGSTLGAAAVAAAAHSYMGAVGGTRTPPVRKSSSYGTSPFPSRRVTAQ